MSLEKVILALAPVGLGVMVYALTQGTWGNAANLALLEGLVVMNYRTEKRIRSAREPEHRHGD
jgi:hypothetical protein